MANLTGTQASDWRSDGSLAYGLFRFTFGVNIMMRGIVRIAMGLPAFQTYMLTQFKDVPVMPVVGFQTRAALVAGSLMITALTFGTMLRQDFTIAWLQVDYAIAFFILIALRSWNLISVDAMMRKGRTETAAPARIA